MGINSRQFEVQGMLPSDARMLHVGKHSAKWLLLNCIGSTSLSVYRLCSISL